MVATRTNNHRNFITCVNYIRNNLANTKIRKRCECRREGEQGESEGKRKLKKLF